MPRLTAEEVVDSLQRRRDNCGLFDKHELDIADIRKRCESSIRNTPVGSHLGKCLDEIERLRKIVAEQDRIRELLKEAVNAGTVGDVGSRLRMQIEAAIIRSGTDAKGKN